MSLFRTNPNFDLQVQLGDSKKVIDRLSRLDSKVQKRIATKAARRGMAIVRKAAVAEAKKLDSKDSPRKIWKNIAIVPSRRKGKKIQGVFMQVGVRGGARTPAKGVNTSHRGGPGGYTWYWRFLEFGTQKMPASSFLRPALANNSQAVTDEVFRTFNQEIDKEFTIK